MMELDEIMKYAHKIKTIHITNKNKQSIYSHIIIKISLLHNDDETIRFSINPNDNFIDHQCHFNNEEDTTISTNDYYCYIPNNLNSVTTLYAHFFPSDLYTYENELTTLVSNYDFKDIFENARIDSHKYTYELNEEEHLKVQSIDNTSVTKNHDPNYKNYTTTNNDNKTEQGKFPLSSRYRSEQNWQVPNLTDVYPKWEENNDAPYWEARIPFEGAEAPMNVFINYEYLPTSREYHQHYFGFEGATSNSNTINVFEGTNINILDNKFRSENNYRLINLGNPYDDERSIYVPHENIIPIDLEEFTLGQKNCQWSKDDCQDYYIYSPKNINSNQGYCTQTITLNEGHYYSLQYYIYIPSYAHVDSDTCYISVITNDKEYKLHNSFINKDKELRDKWIYHEIPFLATERNTIKIIGPQSFDPAIDTNNDIYFIHMSLQEMVEYSPTLQYTSTSVRLMEQDKYTYKPISEKSNNVTIDPDDKKWTTTEKEFPQPYSNVNITTEHEKYIYYDPYTTNLYYYHSTSENDNERLITYDETTNKIILGNNVVYENDTIKVTYPDILKGTYGPDNIFIFYVTDDYGEYVTNGTIDAGIFINNNTNQTKTDAKIRFNYNPVPVNGVVTFKNIDLTNLTKTNDNKYYIRLEYNFPCNKNKKVVFKPVHIYEENISIDKIKINNTIQNINNKYIINDIEQFPIKIEAHIVNQNDDAQTTGYCELSINDDLQQTSIIDDGWVDFYLSLGDLEFGTQTIKIEYYRKYFKSLAFIYFDIDLKEIDIRDKVPIEIKILQNGKETPLTSNTYNVTGNDCVLSTITMDNKHEKFRLEVYRDNVLIIEKNIFVPTNNSISFINTEYGDFESHTFKIKTGNIKDDNGNTINDLWKDYEKTFTITYS